MEPIVQEIIYRFNDVIGTGLVLLGYSVQVKSVTLDLLKQAHKFQIEVMNTFHLWPNNEMGYSKTDWYAPSTIIEQYSSGCTISLYLCFRYSKLYLATISKLARSRCLKTLVPSPLFTDACIPTRSSSHINNFANLLILLTFIFRHNLDHTAMK